MKKISLKSITTEELLSRAELKQIMGGVGGSGCSGEKEVPCYCSDGAYHGCREKWECALACS